MAKNSDFQFEEIKELNKDNLISIIRHNTNHVLVLLKEINFNNLLENSRIAKKLQKNKIILMYLTKEYMKTSCDVYPLEYISMKNSYEVVYGDDILQELNVPTDNVRLESEQKIKGALIRITQIILEMGDRKKELSKTVFLAVEDIVHGIKGLLNLAGVTLPDTAAAVLDSAQKQFNIELQPVKDIVNWRSGTAPEDYKKLIYDFYEKIEELAVLADKMEIS
ncbi:MAG: hypothetical protein ABIH89_00320 [Elusimicrobiota bacterium]